MGVRLSLEGSREVLEEMSRPPADTPERRATFAGVRLMRERREMQELADATGISLEGAREVLEQTSGLPAHSPERHLVFERVYLAEAELRRMERSEHVAGGKR